jgi:Flp pilus assembly pilin Flp
MEKLVTRVHEALRREDGQTFVEYALIAVLLAAGISAAVLILTGGFNGAMQDIVDYLT